MFALIRTVSASVAVTSPAPTSRSTTVGGLPPAAGSLSAAAAPDVRAGAAGRIAATTWERTAIRTAAPIRPIARTSIEDGRRDPVVGRGWRERAVMSVVLYVIRDRLREQRRRRGPAEAGPRVERSGWPQCGPAR